MCKIVKKLLIIAKSLGGGGSEVALIEFLNHLDLKKYNVTLLLLDKDNEYKYRLKQNINIKYIKFDSNFYHSLASMYSLPGKAIKKLGLNHYFDIYGLLAKHSRMKNLPHFDLAIDFYGYGAFTTAFLALNVKADKKAVWLHDEHMPWIINVDRYFDKLDKIFGVSKSIKKTFDKLYPQYKEKSDVFFNVVNVKVIKEKAQEFYPDEFEKNTNIIVTVGRLTEQKGYDIAIKAASKLKASKLKFKWFVLGNGRDKVKLHRLIKKFNLTNNFILLGRKNNPYPYIKNCDIYVQPSRHEGYGLSVLEAKILDKPIIVSDLPAFKEQINDKINGIVCDLTPISLAKSINLLIQDKELCRHLVKKVSKENFDFCSNVKKIDSI